ncbi:MAG: ABC transporter permease [Proteobacteria bacterium]|nr:ABC transporter permease [Pseudomonadota bacterium]
MLTMIVRRLLLAIPTIIAITALLFFSVTTILGSPAGMMLGQDASTDAIAALNARYGFDRPAIMQYGAWIAGAIQGDFGRSFTTQQSVARAIADCIPVTLEMTLWSILLATTAAVILNTIPVARRALAGATTAVNLIGITVPNFMLGISLIFLFSVWLGWLPSTGWAPWSDGVAEHLKRIIMPVLTLSAYYFGVFSIVYRAEYRDVAQRMFIQVARAKGLSEWMVAFKHALPNAILPVITFVGITIGQLTGGAVVTETVFSMPGTGRLFVSAIAGHDFPVMLAIGMLIVTGVILMNLLADIAYTIVNPQIRFD